MVSIGMFEAAGRAYWCDYFEVLRACLRLGGLQQTCRRRTGAGSQRTSRRRILPVTVLGSSSRNSIRRGYL